MSTKQAAAICYRGIFLFLLLLIGSSKLVAQTTGDYRSNAASMNWNAAASWQKFNGTTWAASTDYPGQNACGSCTVTIQNGHTVTLNITPANSIRNLVIGGGFTGTLTLGTFSLTVAGNLTVNAGATLNLATGNFTVLGTTTTAGTISDASITGVNTFTGLVTKTAGTWNTVAVTLASSLIFQSGFTNTAGSFTAGAATIGDNKTLTGTVNMSFANSLTVLGNGDLIIAGSTSAGVSLTGAIVYSFRNLTLTGLLTIGSGNLTVTGTTNITGTGGFLDNNNSGINTFYGLVTHNSTGAWNSVAVTAAAAMVFQAGFTNTAGTFSAGAITVGDNKTLTGTVNMNIANGITVLGNGDLNIAGSTTSGVTFAGTAIYIVRNLNLTGKLTVSTTGNFIITGTTNITGNGAFEDNNNASITFFTGLVTHNSAGAWNTSNVTTAANMVFNGGYNNIAGAFTAGAATVGTGQTLNGAILMTFNNGLTAPGDITIAGVRGVRFAGTGANYSVAGNLILTGTLVVSTSGNLTVNGTTSITGAGDFTDNNNTGTSTFTGLVTHNSTGRWVSTSVTTAARMVFSAGFTNTAGSFSAGAATIGDSRTLTGTVNMTFSRGINVLGNKDITIAGTATTGVTFGGTGIAYTARNLIVTGLLTVSTTGNFSVTGTTTISGNGSIVDNQGTGTTSFTGLVTLGATARFTATAITTVGRLTFAGGITNNNTTALSFYAGVLRTTATQTWSGAGGITTNGVMDVNVGTLTNNMTGIVNVTGTLTGTTLVQGANAFLSLGSNTPLSITTLTSTATGNTIEYRSTGTATIRAQTYYHLTIAGGTKNIPASDISVNGNLTISNGVLSNTTNNRNILLAGNWINNAGTGGFAAGTGTVTLSGTSTQTIGGSAATSFRNLTITNASGINQTVGSTINGVLTLTAGIVNNGSNTIIISSTGSVTRTAGHINGTEQRNFATGTNVSRTFDIGDATKYTPVSINVASVSAAGNITAGNTATDHPSVFFAQLNSTRSVNRYYTITNGGLTFTTYSAVFTFASTDVDAGANTSAFIGGNYNGGSWTYPAVGTKTATSTQLTGITGFGDFAIAEFLSCTIPTLTITNPAPICSPATANLTAAAVTAGSSSGQVFTYWMDNTATTPLTTPAAVGTSGTYYIKGTIAGGCANIKPVVVTRGNPSGNITGSANICAGSGTALSIALTGTGPWSGTLSDGTSFSGTTSPVTVSVNPVINSTYTINTLSAGGCLAQAIDKTGSATVTLTSPPTVANAGVDQNICGVAVNLGANTPLIGTGSWSIISGTGGSFSSINNPLASFSGTAGSTYVLRWSIANAPCAVSSDDVLIAFSAGMWTGAADTVWSNPANWCSGAVPASIVDLVLPAGLSNYPQITSNVIVNDLTIASNANIKITNTGKLTVRGNYNNSGTLVNDGLIILNGTAQQHFPGATATVSSMKDLEVDNEAGVVIDQSFSITGTLTPTLGTIDLADKKITLVSNAAGTARVAEVDGDFDYSGGGKFIVQRFLPARRSWRLLTAPLTVTNTIRQGWQNNGVYTPGMGTIITGASTAGGLDAISGSSLKEFNVLTQSLVPVLNTNVPVSPGTSGSADNKGYFLFVRGDRSMTATNQSSTNTTVLCSEGQLQTGTQTFEASPAQGNYTLIGNPYASPIDFNTVTRSNVLKRFYAWDHTLNAVGGYVVLDDLDDDGIFTSSVLGSIQTSEILSHQAVFVQTAADGAASLIIEESDKTDGSTYAVTKPATPSSPTAKFSVNLYLLNADKTTILADGIKAEFNDDFSNEVDFKDPVKFANVNETFGLVRSGTTLAMERRRMPQYNDTLYLKITRTTQRDYQFVFKPENISIGLTAYLLDAYLNKQIELSVTTVTSINFTINKDAGSAAADRFRIVFRPYQVLPVTFATIKATQQKAAVKVDWTVENEIDIDRYEVQHSNDGSSFTGIGTVLKKDANTAGSLQYSWLDKDPFKGSNFYRIKSVEQGGQSKYSAVVKVVYASGKSIRIFNTAEAAYHLHVEFNQQEAGTYILELFNTNGQAIYNQTISVADENVKKIIMLPSTISKGVYHVEINGPGNTKTLQSIVLQ